MKITTASMSFLSAALAAGASGHRLLQENGTDSDIPEVWGPTEPIGGGASEFDGTYTSGSDVEAHLVELLETDEQVSGKTLVERSDCRVIPLWRGRGGCSFFDPNVSYLLE